jgi:carbon-monoxide dehydrogenase large subunit
MSVTDQAPPSGGHVGRRLRRKEDPRLITGRAGYIDDLALPAMLWAAIVRSPEANAKIVSIDTSAASARPGVHAVFTGTDMGDLGGPLPMAWVPPGVQVNNPDRWPLARDSVKHVGDPVAVVIGEDRYAVYDAAEDVLVEYDGLPAVTDPEAALKGGPLVHEQFGTNQVHEWSLSYTDTSPHGQGLETGMAQIVADKLGVDPSVVESCTEIPAPAPRAAEPTARARWPPGARPLPAAAELPSFETDRTETPSPVNSLGVKGVGEAGTIAASAAVTCAVVDALRPLGVSYINMPLSPMRVWEAISQAKDQNGGVSA